MTLMAIMLTIQAVFEPDMTDYDLLLRPGWSSEDRLTISLHSMDRQVPIQTMYLDLREDGNIIQSTIRNFIIVIRTEIRNRRSRVSNRQNL